MKLLIADDHTLFRDALMQYLSRAEPDADVVLAQDFFETASILKKDQTFDLVVLDLRMPGMRGLDGVSQICRDYPAISQKRCLAKRSFALFKRWFRGKPLFRTKKVHATFNRLTMMMASENKLPLWKVCRI